MKNQDLICGVNGAIQSPRITTDSSRIFEMVRMAQERLERQGDMIRLDTYPVDGGGIQTIVCFPEWHQIFALTSVNLWAGHYKPKGGDPGRVYCAATLKFEDVIIPEQPDGCICGGCGDKINSLYTGVE